VERFDQQEAGLYGGLSEDELWQQRDQALLLPMLQQQQQGGDDMDIDDA
jgi:hypothetical protein